MGPSEICRALPQPFAIALTRYSSLIFYWQLFMQQIVVHGFYLFLHVMEFYLEAFWAELKTGRFLRTQLG